MISSIQNSTTNLNFKSSFYDKFFKNLPNKEIKDVAKFNKLGQALASPHWNRVALGVAAMTFQPCIDYFNPKVDRDTAESSALRTVAKITVCTSVGFIIRGLSYKLVNKFANGSAKEGSTLLTPKEILEESNKLIRDNKVKLHKNTLSTLVALAVMVFTNFLIDAPLTTFFANKLISKHNSKKAKKSGDIIV